MAECPAVNCWERHALRTARSATGLRFGEHEGFCLLKCDAMQYVRKVPKCRRNLLLPISG
jgi:hypothetical protein